MSRPRQLALLQPRPATLIVALLLAALTASVISDWRISAQTNATIQLQTVATGLSAPVLVTNAHDGTNRLFIVEQTGLIKVLQPGATTPTVFLDVTSRRVYGGERGLLGLTFHPQFASNRRFFINYTRTPDGATVVAEYQASPSNPNIALTTEKVIIVVAQPFENHNGGMIEFGPDGYLYVGMGDGGSANDPANRAQNRNDLLGKMLRIDVDQSNGAVPYVSPPTNPYFGPTDGRDEIFAIGLRNPWRYAFDRLTGQLWAGDVGQGQREEVDIVTRGGNYGWRVFEGTRCTGLDQSLCIASNYAAPVFEYTHAGSRCSLTGGYVYRGLRSSLPYGSYVYGDYCTGEILLWENATQRLLLDTSLSISSFGEDESGELYVCGLSGGVYRITNPAAGVASTVSAASFSGARLAPGSIAAVFGSQLATSTASAIFPLPTSLAGSEVRIRDSATGAERLSQLLFVSPGQINFIVPDSVPEGQAEIKVVNSQGAMATGTALIMRIAPGLFAANADGGGAPAGYITRVYPNGSQVIEGIVTYQTLESRFVPAPIDFGPPEDQIILSLFGTGIRLRSTNNAVEVRVVGDPQQVLFAGSQGTFAGLDQINVALSRTLVGRGEVGVQVTVEGVQANQLALRFK
jgi:uncharacterized protein (TIGR03437 family)